MSVTGKSDRRSIKRQMEQRKRRLIAALALAGLDQQDFAREAGVTPGHLSQVLSGKRESQTLTEKIDRYIAQSAAAA